MQHRQETKILDQCRIMTLTALKITVLSSFCANQLDQLRSTNILLVFFDRKGRNIEKVTRGEKGTLVIESHASRCSPWIIKVSYVIYFDDQRLSCFGKHSFNILREEESSSFLIMDNNQSHLSIEFLDVVKENCVTILTLHLHRSAKLWHLDFRVLFVI